MHNINKILKAVKSTIKTAFHGDIDVFIHVTVDNTMNKLKKAISKGIAFECKIGTTSIL